ncbi:MAG TPA: TIGR03435 family protein [Bryobacteraceae bacterium]|jgi:uncharacterized protein (TIGR03435 family)
MIRTAVVLCIALGAPAWAQSFEVASIKKSPPPDPNRSISGFQVPGGGRFSTVNTPLRMMLTFAYDVQDYQIAGGPGWANSETYDITAKAAANATPPELRTMLQTLLRERFKVAVRRETREGPVYELVAAKGGAKIQADTTSPRTFMMQRGRGRASAQKATMEMFTRSLGILVGRPVVDKTGLGSTYTFELSWTPEPGQGGVAGPAGNEPAPADSNGPSLFTAVQEQLGLQLKAAKGPVEYLVIESAEKPSEN